MLSTDSNYPLVFDSREQAKAITAQLIASAKREINFYGSNIDHVLFDNQDVIQLLSDFARRNQRTIIRFLVHSTLENNRQGHQLISLSQRLTSSILIHNTDSTHHTDKDMFLLIDDASYAHFKTHHFYQGDADMNNQATVRKLRQRFDGMWEKSNIDPNIRRLAL